MPIITLGDTYRSKLVGREVSGTVLSGGSFEGDINVNFEGKRPGYGS